MARLEPAALWHRLPPRFLCVLLFEALVSALLTAACGGSEAPDPTPTAIVSPTPSQEASAFIMAVDGGEVRLPDGARIVLPPNALPRDATVSLRKSRTDQPAIRLQAGDRAGLTYEVNLEGLTLNKSATLELPYDPSLLPTGTSEDTIFLAFYDAAAESWQAAGGEADPQRKVVFVEITHASWWAPWTWNWDAWIAVLNKTLTLNLTDFVEAVALLTNDCPRDGKFVQVDLSRANNVIQGCIEDDDAELLELRLVNPKSFYFEVKPTSGGDGSYPPASLLGPGESLGFAADTSDPAPLVVSAEITQAAGYRLITALVIRMLPAARLVSAPMLACISDRIGDEAEVAAAVEALILDHDGLKAAEHVARMMTDDHLIRLFLDGAEDCGQQYGIDVARTWTVAGIRQIGASTSVIISATDFIANYVLNFHSEVEFRWVRPSDNPPPAGTPLIGAIELSAGGRIRVTINSTSNACDGDLHLKNPKKRLLWSGYNAHVGASADLGPYPEGAHLTFAIAPYSFCEGVFDSTDPTHARITAVAPNEWVIEWEDKERGDADYNDLVITVELRQ